MQSPEPLVTIVMPHWQVQEMITLCLRSIRKYTPDIPFEVIVVDNNSQDASLGYLRSLPWIRLFERGNETPENWVRAMGTALDFGIREGRGRYLLIMHTDVLIKKQGWLGRLVEAIESDPRHAAAGTGKLELRSPLAAWWKRTFDEKRIKAWLRRTFARDQKAVVPKRPDAPRDFCALYRLDVLRKHNLSFLQKRFSAGESMYLDLVDNGYTAAMVPVAEMMDYIEHVAHGTAGLRPGERRLHHSHTQRKTERRLRALFAQPYVRALQADSSLDR